MNRKVTDLKENEVIHCQTQEDFDRIIAMNPNNDLDNSIWASENHKTCYRPNARESKGEYSRKSFFEDHGFTIYPASDFLAPSIDEKIQDLKDFAKTQGMKCEVVLSPVPKRIEVEYYDWCYDNRLTKRVSLNFEVPNWDSLKDKDDIGLFLAKQLEDYLNGEIGKEESNV